MSDDGQTYLDVDPTSFRLILAILNGTFDLNSSQDVGSLSRADFALLKATARYLMLDFVHSQLEKMERGIMEEFTEMLRKKDDEIRQKDAGSRDRDEFAPV